MTDYSGDFGLTDEQINAKAQQDPTYNPRDLVAQRDQAGSAARLKAFADTVPGGIDYSSELQDILRAQSNSSGTGAAGGQTNENAVQAALAKLKARAANSNGPADAQPPTNPVVSSWSSVASLPGPAANIPSTGQNADRNSQLYDLLTQRATQSLSVNPNDPVIAGQTNAFNAAQQKQSRNYLADLAEKAGPTANLAGETRLANEQVGQNTAGFQATLMGNELTARRQEIADALTSMRGLLTTDQQNALQLQLDQLDNVIKNRSLDITQQATNQDWQKALLNNQQFNSQLGLNAEQQASYWDAIRRGQL